MRAKQARYAVPVATVNATPREMVPESCVMYRGSHVILREAQDPVLV
jgi:hypothetical protein